MPVIKYLRRNGLAYLLLLPASSFVFILVFWPMVKTVVLSLQNASLFNLSEVRFVGLTNFRNLLGSDLFWLTFKNTLIWTFGSLGGEYLLGLSSALLLNQEIKGRTIFRGIIVIPWAVPVVVAALNWRWILNPDFGIVNILLVRWGLLKESFYWLGEINTALATCILVNVWRSFPFFTIALLAALQAIPKEEIDAAKIDGAGSLQIFKHITLPHLRTVSAITTILIIIWTFNYFDFVWLLTEGGPLHASEVLATLVYKNTFRYYQVSFASAIAVIMMGFLVMFGVLYLKMGLKEGGK